MDCNRIVRRIRVIAHLSIACGAMVSGSHAAAESAPTHREQRPGYEYYSVGDVSRPTPGQVRPGLALLGGGDWPIESFRWFVEHAGGGHIVVLRARGSTELQDEIYRDVGGMASVETLVIHDEDAATDPEIVRIIAHADGVFIGGGDQSNYVRLWKNTPIVRALDAHVAAGKPIGGTSAGLAVLGRYVYACLDTISMTSREALEDPTGSGVTLVHDFLHIPRMEHVITDTHFMIRDRLGRLVAFVGRLEQERGDPLVRGLGIDEDVAMIVEADGKARVLNRGKGSAWLVRPSRPPATIVAGRPLTFEQVEVTEIGPQSVFTLGNDAVEHPVSRQTIDVRDGAFAVVRP